MVSSFLIDSCSVLRESVLETKFSAGSAWTGVESRVLVRMVRQERKGLGAALGRREGKSRVMLVAHNALKQVNI